MAPFPDSQSNEKFAELRFMSDQRLAARFVRAEFSLRAARFFGVGVARAAVV